MPQPMFTDLINQITVLSRAGIGHETAMLAFDRYMHSTLEQGFAPANPLEVIELTTPTLIFMLDTMLMSTEEKGQLSTHAQIGIALGLMAGNTSNAIHEAMGPVLKSLSEGLPSPLSSTELLNVALAMGAKVNGVSDIKSEEKVQREALGFFILLSIRNTENAVKVDNAICDVTNFLERGFGAYYKGQFQQIPKLSKTNLFKGNSTKWLCDQVISSLHDMMVTNYERMYLYSPNAIDSISNVLIDVQFSSYQPHPLNREDSVFGFLAKTLGDKEVGRGILRSISKSAGVKNTSRIQLELVAARINNIGNFLNSKELTTDISTLKNTLFKGICRAFSSSRITSAEVREIGIKSLDIFFNQSDIVSLHEQLSGPPQDFLEIYTMKKGIDHLIDVKGTVKRKLLTEDFGL